MMTEGFSKDPNVKPVSMLRFLSKELPVETTVETIGEDWFVLLWVICEEEVGASRDKRLHESNGMKELRPRGVSQKESSKSGLDLLKTKSRQSSGFPPSEPKIASRLNPSQVQPGSYDPITKRLTIGSRRLGKRQCCKGSPPCIGTISIKPEFQQQFNLPSFIHVSICHAEFKQQLQNAGSADSQNRTE